MKLSYIDLYLSIPWFASIHHQGPGLGCAAQGDGEGPRSPCNTCVPLSPYTRGQKGDETWACAEREPLLISQRTNTHLTPYTACSNGSGRILLGTVARTLTEKKNNIYICIFIYTVYIYISHEKIQRLPSPRCVEELFVWPWSWPGEGSQHRAPAPRPGMNQHHPPWKHTSPLRLLSRSWFSFFLSFFASLFFRN